MKRFLFLILIFIFFTFTLDEKILGSNLYSIYTDYYKETNYSIVTNLDALKTSKYSYNDYSSFVKTTTNYFPKNNSEMLNIYYSILNNGWENFSYNCDSLYKSCLNDVEVLSKDDKTFTSINQLVHPFNSFSLIQSSYTDNGRVDVNTKKKYTNDEIKEIDLKINDIINELNINDYKDVKDKIRLFHDYIANTNKYDINKESGNSKYNSNNAIGTLFEGYSICSGYTDTMAIFLSKIGLENIRVANDGHTWNAVKINGKWKHIDLTWDDPITNTNEDIIIYDYFLIDTDALIKKNEKEHIFDTNIYNFLN